MNDIDTNLLNAIIFTISLEADMKRILSSVLMLMLSSVVVAEDKDVFVANNGITLINVPADKSVSRATFDSSFDIKSVSYETQARTASDSYLMHCFSKKKKDSTNYERMDKDTKHFCLNETGQKLAPGLADLKFPDFKVVKEIIKNKHIRAISVAMKGKNTVISTLTDQSSIPNLKLAKNNIKINQDKDYIYTYYSFNPNTGEILNGSIYEYYY